MRFAGLMTGLLALFATGVAGAQMSASQTVTIRVVPTTYAVRAPAPRGAGLTPGDAVAGSYRLATSEPGQKVVVAVDRALPPGTMLAVRSAGSTSAIPTSTTLDRAAPVDLLTDIPPARATTLPMAFVIGTARDPGEAHAERLLTYTIIAGT